MKDLIIGKKFNKWTVIKREANSKSKHKMYLCRCECGRENIISKTTLINGKSTALQLLPKSLIRFSETSGELGYRDPRANT